MKNLTQYSLSTLALTALLVACSAAGSSPEEKHGEPGRVIIDARTGHIDRPLDRYFMSPQDVLQIRKAEASLTNRCMRDLRYGSHPLPTPRMDHEESYRYEFLVFPLSQVRKNGYKNMRKSPDSETDWSRGATRTQRALLDGSLRRYKGHAVPEGGCSTFAAQTLMKGAKPHRIKIEGMSITPDTSATPDGIIDTVMSALRYSTAVRSDSDERVKGVNEKWASCMQEAGFHYTSPQAAANDGRWHGSKNPSQLETAVAVADMGCKTKVRYLDTVVEVQSAYERNLIAKQSPTLASLRKASKVWLDHARAEVNK
ncbi:MULTISPECIES: hypothetical protein [Streptomyces]|uniref:hypothetical protein n=1 Tax=Streptomyces TaxID=1883 RepID=UPI0029BE77DC|nr:hypothetical protein [Streptomyces sp. WI03-4A]MDX2597959.1 hypothetical protein [Streptomyces sp. WI03-4A]